jgi:hypothetical protein
MGEAPRARASAPRRPLAIPKSTIFGTGGPAAVPRLNFGPNCPGQRRCIDAGVHRGCQRGGGG